MKTVIRGLAALALAVILSGIGLLLVARAALAPQPDEWQVRLGSGRWAQPASVPTLLRWATHPLAQPRLDGRRLRGWTLHARPDGGLEAHCAPCRFRLAALGQAAVELPQATLVLHARGADRYDGLLRLGAPARSIDIPWRGEMGAAGLRLHAELAPTPLVDLVALFGDAVPEASTARIEGRVGLALDARLGAQGLQLTALKPAFEGLRVDGLGTERLRDADAGARCRPQPAGGRIEGWIQNAVIAAEDARFFEHPGYELEQWVAAGKANQSRPEALQGASTITQQLAKLLYTGDERSAARKLREFLYALEMERTLGKGRILQLYLAVLPWGDGICGAEAAARHHLGKPANQLKPREAAWLASLLVNPDEQLRRWSSDEAAGRARAAAVLKGIRRLPRERREAELDALAQWQPPVGRSLLATTPAKLTSAAP
ncbi:biosynthetic peptidoglycan transglycosylase [Piscinibacter defluvii]|uniref:biosynthetic peptidoglycan transglycosylase n=1 Tax=Piscinibacter defluvii TaxID=1796922 RepID=UPI000FDD77D3|nr:biosynthetic peptidoglycan transglycosylase [Piscinibacter defluvii]